MLFNVQVSFSMQKTKKTVQQAVQISRPLSHIHEELVVGVLHFCWGWGFGALVELVELGVAGIYSNVRVVKKTVMPVLKGGVSGFS